MLKVSKLHKYYHNFARKPLHVINNTSLEIPKTGIIAVIGESGAGKTTLINTISGLDSFKSGTIEFEGTKMSHYRNSIADKLRMKNYGFIFQNYYLLEKQTVYENVKISLDTFEMSEEEKKRRINYVLTQLGIAKYTNKVVSNLSGGEQQRVSIARALVKSPRVIFADEPTGSLDEKTTFNVLNILKKVSKNCAVFIVTHKRELISYYADYIIELEKGIVVKEFTPVKPEEKSLLIDQNIYLQELDHKGENERENINFDIYSDGSSVDKSNITIAIKNNKIYLQANEDIVLLTDKSEKQLINSKPFKIKDYVQDDFEYEFEPIESTPSKTNVKEIIRRGYKNYKTKRPIKNLLKIVCAVLSALSIVLIEGINTIKNTNLSSDLTSSQGNLYLKIDPDGDDMNYKRLSEAYVEVAKEFEQSDNSSRVMFELKDDLYFDYNGFYQIQSRKYSIPYHDLKDIRDFDSKTLVYGKMPSNGYEVVIDEYILEHFLSESLLSGVISNYNYFIGKTFYSFSYDYGLTISGICRTKSPTIYCYECVNFMRVSYNCRGKVIDLDYAKQLYPQLEGVTIEKGHCLTNVKYNYFNFNYLISDGFFEDIPYEIIINPADITTIKYKIAENRNTICISTNGTASALETCKKIVKNATLVLQLNGVKVKIEIENRYQHEKEKATSNIKTILTYTEIVALVVVVLALILIVFSTYLSMLAQISDIAVYRSIGYSRRFLGAIYLVELLFLALLYSFIGGAVTFFAMFALDVIPLVSYSISSPIYLILAMIFGVAFSIVFIGLIPILVVFRLTPAKIYNRFNRRINNI